MQCMRVCAYISKDAIRHNFNEIKKSLPEGVKVMPVIKADGYGHGASFFAKELCNDADYFAVAVIEEALALRKEGIVTPVMLLGYTFPQYFEVAVENDITLTIFTLNDARMLAETARRLGKTAKIHIAVETGMSRIGFFPTEENADVVKEISQLDGVFLEGMFTHFSTADEENKEFTKLQYQRFTEFKSMLEKRGVKIEICHCANSGAIMQHKEYCFDMVRPGIILYGLNPSDQVPEGVLNLKSVMELVAHVAYVKTIKKGDTVSYGRTFTADRDMKIATIPVGYADGYPRLLSNRGRVIIGKKYAPVVGRVCMDQFMVDVTEIEGVSTGDKVILIGKEGDLCITADEIARNAQTINYEIVCGIGKRVPRVLQGSD